MSITKNVLLNWYSSMKNKLKKIPMIFDIVKFWHFLTPPHYTNSQNSIISFEYVDSWISWQNLELFLNNFTRIGTVVIR